MRRRASSRRLGMALAALTAFLVATTGCGEAAPDGRILIASLDPATADAVRFRQAYGLIAEPSHVRRVADDPAAVLDYGVPLLPFEVQEIEARPARARPVTEVVRAYAALHLEEFGGLYIDHARFGVVTVLWTANIETHAANLAEALADVGPVIVRPVRTTEADLEALSARIVADQAWLAEIPAVLKGVEVDVVDNRVRMFVSSSSSVAADLIWSHYEVHRDVLLVESDGTGSALAPLATIRGRVVTADGSTPGNNSFMVVARGGGSAPCAGDVDEMGHGVNADGTFEIQCSAGSWTIAIQDAPIAGPDGVDLGHLDVLVPAGGVLDIVIELDP